MNSNYITDFLDCLALHGTASGQESDSLLATTEPWLQVISETPGLVSDQV